MEKETKIKKTEIQENIFLLEFETQMDLASTFLRFQEHYESPQFRGRVFDLDEYKEWYKNQKGDFTYYTDWSGFNIPSHILNPFREGKFNPLSSKEKDFLNLFVETDHPFYIIGLSLDKKEESQKISLEHEIAHGLFYTLPAYRDKVLGILEKYDLDSLEEWLRASDGYHGEVIKDECHAYGLSGHKNLADKVPENLKLELRETFNEYYKP